MFELFFFFRFRVPRSVVHAPHAHSGLCQQASCRSAVRNQCVFAGVQRVVAPADRAALLVKRRHTTCADVLLVM